MRYLSSRHREVSQWQAQFSEIIGQLEREVTALEQACIHVVNQE